MRRHWNNLPLLTQLRPCKVAGTEIWALIDIYYHSLSRPVKSSIFDLAFKPYR
ncbi:hypothetical protein CGRA01v4_08108 [Colletotrichum graminicola]|nr:hypothetical protein CGRA01v4_08108 [Colletotrichum graminicola]